MIRYDTGNITVDSKLNLVSANDAYKNYVKKECADTFLDNVNPEDKHLLEEMAETIGGHGASLCFRFLRNDGKYSWVAAQCFRMDMGDDFNIQIAMQDISYLEDRNTDARIDFGTGLLDKKAITDYAKDKCMDPSNDICLCILDLDNFKNINDTKGHSYGDMVLREVGQIVATILGSGGKAGRIGGDEMMLVIEDAKDKAALRSYLKPIRETVESLHKDKEGNPLVTVSIGSGRFPSDVGNYEMLFDLADRMLYRAKSKGKNRYVMYNPDIHGVIINGLLREEDKTIKDATPLDKTKLVVETIEGFFGKANLSVNEQLAKIIATYDLDEAYVFFRDMARSVAGYKRLEPTQAAEEIGVKRVVDVSTEITYSMEPGFTDLFGPNRTLVIDSPKIQLKNYPKTLQYFEDKQIKHAFYYMLNGKDQEGFILFFNTNELARKFSQPDVTDFTYLGKMIEIALKSR